MALTDLALPIEMGLTSVAPDRTVGSMTSGATDQGVFVGFDVSLEESYICVNDEGGRITPGWAALVVTGCHQHLWAMAKVIASRTTTDIAVLKLAVRKRRNPRLVAGSLTQASY